MAEAHWEQACAECPSGKMRLEAISEWTRHVIWLWRHHRILPLARNDVPLATWEDLITVDEVARSVERAELAQITAAAVRDAFRRRKR